MAAGVAILVLITVLLVVAGIALALYGTDGVVWRRVEQAQDRLDRLPWSRFH